MIKKEEDAEEDTRGKRKRESIMEVMELKVYKNERALEGDEG